MIKLPGELTPKKRIGKFDIREKKSGFFLYDFETTRKELRNYLKNVDFKLLILPGKDGVCVFSVWGRD